MFEELLEKYKIDQNKSKQEIAKDLARERNRKQGILDNANDLERIKSLRNELAELDDAINHFNTVVDIGFTGIIRDTKRPNNIETKETEDIDFADEDTSKVEQVENKASETIEDKLEEYETNPPTDPNLQYRIGIYYEEQKNYIKAVEWLKKAAGQEYPDAMLAMVKYYKKSDFYGVELEEKEEAELDDIVQKALVLLEKEADRLNEIDRDSEEAMEASLKIARIYFHDGMGIEDLLKGQRTFRNYHKAEKYYQYLAEEKNNPEALYALAHIAQVGKDDPDLGIWGGLTDTYLDKRLIKRRGEIDSTKAVELAERAANLGYAKAFVLLGDIYRIGGAEQKKISKQNSLCPSLVYECLDEPHLVFRPDKVMATMWYLRAEENGIDCTI